MKKALLRILLIIVLLTSCNVFLFCSCDNNAIYTKVYRAKELVQNIEKLPSSYSSIDQSINNKSEHQIVASASPLYSNSTLDVQTQATNLKIEEVPNGDFYANEEFDNIFDNMNPYVDRGSSSVFSSIDFEMDVINVIKHYKNIALETVKQLSVWVEGPKQTFKKYDESGLLGFYYIEKPAFQISYDVNADVVKLECKGNCFGSYEIYIKAYCSYNANGALVISALSQFVHGYDSIYPRMEVTNIQYVEDEYMLTRQYHIYKPDYNGTLSREEFYKVYDEIDVNDYYYRSGYTWIIDLKTGDALLSNNTLVGDGQSAEYFTRYNNYIIIAKLYERGNEFNINETVNRFDDADNYMPYQKRAFAATILDENEVPLAVVTNKKVWISSNVTNSQRSTVERFFNLRQFDNVEVRGVSGIAEGIEFVENVIEEKNIVQLPAKDVFAIIDKPVIDRKHQTVDNEVFELLDIGIQGQAMLNSVDGKIDFSDITIIAPQSVLFTEGAEYSAVIALKGSKELIEICSNSATYEGQSLNISLNETVDCKQLVGIDDYVVVVFLAKNTDDGKIRLSNYYPVIADTSEYSIIWQNVLDDETTTKTYDFTYEILANSQNIIVSQYYMVSISSKQ